MRENNRALENNINRSSFIINKTNERTMKRKDYLGSKMVEKRYYPTEDPKYGQAFQLVSVQFENIDREYSDWISHITLSIYGNNLISVGKDWNEWRKKKKQISDNYCHCVNSIMNKNSTPAKDVVALKVHYLGDPAGVYQIL